MQDIITDDSLIMDMPIVQALSDLNGIPYRQFYGYAFAYESFSAEDVTNLFFLLFSMMYAASGLMKYGTYWKMLRGKIDVSPLGGLFRKLAYASFVSSGPNDVVVANAQYMFGRFMALTTTAMIMWWSYPVFIVYKFFRGRSFDFDFDEIEEEGKKLSNKQGVVYHYWGDSRYQGWFASYKTHVKDFWLGLLGFLPWVIINVVYWPSLGINILILPLTISWKLLTPWKEKDNEDIFLWFS